MSKGLLWKEWRQNAWIFILILIACVGSEMISASNMIDGFNNNYNYYYSEEFQKDNDNALEEEQMTAAGILESIKLTPYDFEGSWVLYVLLFLFLGLKVTVFEKNKQMEYFTYGLPYSKKQIFWHKMIFPALLILVAFPSIIFLKSIYIYQKIPAMYLPDFSKIWIFISAVVVLLLFTYTVASAIGNLVGEIVVAGVIGLGAILSFFYMFPVALTNLIVGFKAIFRGETIAQLGKDGDLWLSRFPSFFGEIVNTEDYILLIIIIIAMLIISWFGLKTASLENNGRFLMNNKFRLPILIIGTIYVTICLSGRFQYYNYEEMITSGQIVALLIKMIIIALVTSIFLWIVIYKWKTLRKN